MGCWLMILDKNNPNRLIWLFLPIDPRGACAPFAPSCIRRWLWNLYRSNIRQIQICVKWNISTLWKTNCPFHSLVKWNKQIFHLVDMFHIRNISHNGISTDIERRSKPGDPRPILSCLVKWYCQPWSSNWGIQILTDHTWGNESKQNAPMNFTFLLFTHVYLCAQIPTDTGIGTWWITASLIM